jgi:hypothetical protein
VVRGALVAALLALAAGVLYAREPSASCPPAVGAAPTSAPGSESPAPGGEPPRPALPSGLVGVPVRLAEPAALAVVPPGARVDLLASRGDGKPKLLASEALVLDVVDADAVAGGYPALYLALPPDRARAIAGMPEDTRFTVLVR